MKTKRIKKSLTIPATRAEAEAIMNELAQAANNLRNFQFRLDQELPSFPYLPKP